MNCGLLGRKLGHSYSPAIHAQLGSYSYSLFEVEPEELADFLKNGDFTGLNVTMPYKKAVIPYLDAISETAQRLGAVNTIVKQNGRLVGHNTDYFGFTYLLRQSGLAVSGKKALVLGSGGASQVACAVLREMGARVIVISRSGENHYQNLQLHNDAELLVNTTPAGMYPHNGDTLLDLAQFPHLSGVVDVIYNPRRTALLMQAEALGIPGFGGLPMLVAQAWEASQWFTGTSLPEDSIKTVAAALNNATENIIFIGMPGCGKSAVGALVAQKLGKPFLDADKVLEKKAGMSIPEIFERFGEAYFRNLETQTLEELGKQSGLVIACGGGAVTRTENYPLLHQNGRILWLQRPVGLLPTDGRPLSRNTDLQQLYEARHPMYAAFADCIINNSGQICETVKNVLETCV